MAGRWRDPTAFRADPTAVASTRPTRRQSVALLAVLVLVAGLVTAVSYLVEPDEARTFDLFGGSLFLADAVAPVAVDLASGQPTVRLVDASAQVGAARAGEVGVVPLRGPSGGTLLVDRATGEFNLADATGFVLKKDGGVPLPQRTGATGARALAAGDFAYIEQSGPTGTSVYLVGAATVQSATAGAAVKPRGFRSLPEQVSTASGAAATAGRDLWLLTGTGERRTVRHLSLPANSVPGATLDVRSAASVDGPAALTGTTDGVAVATAGRVTVFGNDGSSRTVRVPTVAGLDAVLPVTNARSQPSFLLHGSAGWSVLSVDADGGERRGPTPLTGLARTARLVTPAASEGALWTVDAASGALWRIAPDGRTTPVEGAAGYPTVVRNGRTIEASGYDDVSVTARGPRVIVNSPNHLRAVVVFTDGSREPVAFTKSDAVTINSGGGAEALTRSRNATAPDQSTDPGKTDPTPKPVSPINNLIDCSATSQTPHIPALGVPVPGSRSVQLSWTYPVVDRTDCIPRTYVVGVRLVGGDAPQPPASVTVDGQLGVNLGGLYPSTRYEVTVTALLNGKGTRSAPVQITTGPEGPTTPTGVTATTDDTGTWTVNWSSCGAVATGCVPAASWRVVPQFCDAGGLAGAPANLEVPADPTTRDQPGSRLVGGTALLGRGLRFQVEGIGPNGEVGTPSGASACVRSWSPPDAGAMRLSASRPGDLAPGATTTTTLALDLGDNPVRNVGGVGATVEFTLSGPDGTRQRTATVDGSTSQLAATFDGVRPGATYTASAVVSPPGHPGSAVRVTADDITTRAAWPALGLRGAACTPSGLLTCTLSAQITGLDVAQTGNETFSLTGSSLRCGETSVTLDGGDLDQSSLTITKSNISQLAKFFGSCTLTVGLVESSGNPSPLYFGGKSSDPVSTTVDLGPAQSADLTSSDFTAAWATDDARARVDYTGSKNLDALTTGWRATLSAPDGTSCGTVSDTAPDPVLVPANDCLQKYGDLTTGWKVTLSYADTTDGDQHSVDVAVADGAPPGYKACTPNAPTATWAGDRAAGVTVTVDGTLDGCSSWSYQLTASGGADCGNAQGSPPQNIAITCGDAADDQWTVVVTWKNAKGDPITSEPVPVTGDPPTA